MAHSICNDEGCICIPDCACCRLCHKLVTDDINCPDGNEYCITGDCEYYDEIWDENELKAELEKDEDKFKEDV